MSDFKSDLSDSARDFLRVVWPASRHMLGGGEIVPVESMADAQMATLLDQYSGIDAWHLSNNSQIRGIASRVQWADKPWNTFTVRYKRNSGAKTEYEKRKHDISQDAGWLYPHVTVQAYISGNKGGDGELLSVAMIKTKSLISACDEILEGVVNQKDGGIRRTSNASFIWASWDWLERNRYEIKTINFDSRKAA